VAWSRRKFLAAAGAASCSGIVSAQTRSAAASYRAAAAYSAERRGVSLLVMKDGEILFEDYPRAGSIDQAWELASGTKSFTGIMAAAAQADGLLNIDEPCAAVLPDWAADDRKSITVRHLLSLTSGLDEVGEIARPPTYANAVKAQAVASAGERFAYGPTPFQVFGEILRRRLQRSGGTTDPVEWLQARILSPIGVRYDDWKRGRDGNPYLPQGGQFTARNWAKFGQWVSDGAAGVDPEVFAALFEPTAANPGYGLSWWLLRPGLIGPSPRAGLDAETIGTSVFDEDIVMAAGAGDQRLYLLRDRGLVVVRQANQIVRGMLQSRRQALRWNDGDFIRLLLA
jgi:CubicO group peptidase (beta-lactamase class C family)